MRVRGYSLSPGRPPLERMTAITYFRRARNLLRFPRDRNEPSSRRRNNDQNNYFLHETSRIESTKFMKKFMKKLS